MLEGLSSINDFVHNGSVNIIATIYCYQAADFLERAADQAVKHDLTIVAIVNANTSAKWWHEAQENAHQVRLITGRISFIDILGNRQHKRAGDHSF